MTKYIAAVMLVSVTFASSAWAVLPPPPRDGNYAHLYTYTQNLSGNKTWQYGQYLSATDGHTVASRIRTQTYNAYVAGDVTRMYNLVIANQAWITAANVNTSVLYQHLYNNGYRGSYTLVQQFFTRYTQQDRINAVNYMKAAGLYNMEVYKANLIDMTINGDRNSCGAINAVAGWAEIIGTASFMLAGETPVGWFGGGVALGGMIWDLGLRRPLGC